MKLKFHGKFVNKTAAAKEKVHFQEGKEKEIRENTFTRHSSRG